jgi:hypothetical protein
MRPRNSAKTAALAALALAALVVGAAAAAEITRTEYKAQVEPICKVNSKENERILKGVRKMVRQGKLKAAGAKFLKASAALKKTHRQLKAVPQPTADEARLGRWLGYVKTEADLFLKAGKALKTGRRGKAQRFVNQLTSNANKANATVLAFNFRYCRFNPAKFT